MYYSTLSFMTPGLSKGVSMARLTVEIQISSRMMLLKPLLFSRRAAAHLQALLGPNIQKVVPLTSSMFTN